jgi:flagella basal body P-ring formation protein FlgA
MTMTLSKALAALFALSMSHAAFAQTPSPRQDHGVLRQTVERFLQTQSVGLPGAVTITVGQIDPRLNLPACAMPEAFLPGASRAWGNTTVGLRCAVPSPWTVYVSATVRVMGEYVAAAAPLAQGQGIGPGDITRMKGDLTTLPAGIVTDPAQAVGRTVTVSLAAGTPLRQDALRSQHAIKQGQAVRLVSNGPGFRVSAEARALNNASEGQTIQARTPGGQVISGTARMGGIVEVNY